jgi:hypothetical protein
MGKLALIFGLAIIAIGIAGFLVPLKGQRRSMMQYFDGTEDRDQRVGKIIGDSFAALVYLAVLFLMIGRFS